MKKVLSRTMSFLLVLTLFMQAPAMAGLTPDGTECVNHYPLEYENVEPSCKESGWTGAPIAKSVEMC